MLVAKIVSRTKPPVVIDSVWQWTPFGRWDDPARICTIFRDDLACEGNITFTPGIERWVVAVFTFLAVASLIAFLVVVFRPISPATPDRSPSLCMSALPEP